MGGYSSSVLGAWQPQFGVHRIQIKSRGAGYRLGDTDGIGGDLQRQGKKKLLVCFKRRFKLRPILLRNEGHHERNDGQGTQENEWSLTEEGF